MQVIVTEPFAGEFLGGKGMFALEAANLFDLVRALDALGPGFADAVQERAAIAVDGILQADWSAPLADAAEVLIVPRVAGG